MTGRRLIASALGALILTMTAMVATATPATLAIETSPPVAGVRFSLDGATAVSDPGGRAALPVGRWKDLASRIAVDGAHLGPATRARLVRWAGNLETPRLARQVRAVLEISAPVTLGFVDPRGREVDPGRITVVRLASSQGVVVTLRRRDLAGRVWLPVTRVRSFEFGSQLRPRPITYVVRNVIVGGSSVVHRGQQRLTIGDGSAQDIRVLLYSVRVTVEDALLRRRIGADIELTSPDGSTRTFHREPGQSLDLHSLPRGAYRVRVDAHGLGVSTSFTLSRDTQVPLRVVSDIDLAILMLAGGVLLLGLTAARRGLRARAAAAQERDPGAAA